MGFFFTFKIKSENENLWYFYSHRTTDEVADETVSLFKKMASHILKKKPNSNRANQLFT